jgi:putative transposase
MTNTYTQIHIQAVFTVQNRDCVIRKSWKDELYKYITGIIQNHGHKVLAINGMPDHVHVFFGMRPTQSLSDLMQDIKGDSTKWTNQKKFVTSHFSWQEGYGAFSYSKSHVDSVIEYIKNQEAHHLKRTFIEEYHDFLEKFDVDFDERYIFKPIDYDEESEKACR